MRSLAKILMLSLALLPGALGAAAPPPEVAEEVVGASLVSATQSSMAGGAATAAVTAPQVMGSLPQVGSLPSVPHRTPVPGDWALLIAGLLGVGAIARRRLSSIGDHHLASYRIWRR